MLQTSVVADDPDFKKYQINKMPVATEYHMLKDKGKEFFIFQP